MKRLLLLPYVLVGAANRRLNRIDGADGVDRCGHELRVDAAEVELRMRDA